MAGDARRDPPAPDSEIRRRPIVKRRANRTGLIAVVVIVLLAVVVGAVAYQQKWIGGSKGSLGACTTGTTLQGDGASFIASLASTWVADYQTHTGNVVNYVAGGSGTGITDLSQKTIDFAATDDPLSAAERSTLPGSALTIPIAGGALAIIYNVAGVPSGLKLSGAVLADIYLGKITTWNDPAIAANNTGVALPATTILTVHRSDLAGTSFVLSDYLSQDSAGWASAVGKGISISFPKAPAQDAIKGNSALLSYVQTTPNTIGYSDLPDVLSSTTATTYAAMQNPSGQYVLPNATNTASAIDDRSASTTFPASSGDWYNVTMVNAAGPSDYPLATLAYFFVFQASNIGFEPSLAKAQVIVQWLDWVLSNGQSYAVGLHFVPLSSALVSLDRTGIASMTYDGAPIPACG